MLTIKETACCSLSQIRAVNNTTSRAITAALGALKRRHQHAALIITKPDEEFLVETLRGLDFAPVCEFKRCSYSGYLTMWVKRF